MSGTLEIDEREAWMPAGWVYDNLLKQLGDELHKHDPQLARLFLGGTTNLSGGYLSLKSLSGTQLGLVLASLRAVRQAVVDRGPQGFANPSFFPGYVAQVDELIRLLERDHRVGSQRAGRG